MTESCIEVPLALSNFFGNLTAVSDKGKTYLWIGNFIDGSMAEISQELYDKLVEEIPEGLLRFYFRR